MYVATQLLKIASYCIHIYYVQRTEKRYDERRWKQELSCIIQIFNWKKDKIQLSYPNKLEGWKISNAGYDKVILLYLFHTGVEADSE